MRSKEIETEKNMRKNASGTKENSTAQNILGTIAYIAGVCVFVFLILHFVGQRTVVNGSSMDTTSGQWTESCYGQAFLSIP